MELNFIENENQDWVAEFEATGDFNLHLERDQKGTIIILQKQNEEDEYAFSSEFPNYYKIFNYDFAALLYPKYIKVISDSKVIKGSVNFNEGGGSGSGSGDDSMVYYDVRGNVDVLHGTYNILEYVSMIFIKPYNTSDGIYEKMQPSGLICYDERFYNMDVNEYILAVAVDKNVVMHYDGHYIDMVTLFEDIIEDKSLIKHLTKEQFYNLEA